MKLTYLVNIRFPTDRAHGAQVMKMCEAFGKEGIEVTLLVPERKNNITEDAFSYYGVEKNFTLVYLPLVDYIRWGRIGGALNFLQFVVSAGLYLRRYKTDIIYSRDESVVYVLSFFYKNLVWETHGWKWNFRATRIGAKLQKIIAITRAAVVRYVASGIEEKKFLVAPDGIDEKFFLPATTRAAWRTKFGIAQDTRVAMYLGLLDDWKGYRTLLAASASLRRTGTQVVIAGGSTAQIEKLKQEYPDAQFIGFTPYRLQNEIQSIADVLVIPNSAKSIVSLEYTSPLKLFAHMASGVPMVVADLPSLREIVNESSAFFFEPDDAESLCKTIQESLSDPEASQKKATQANADVLEYTWRKRVQRIIAFVSKK